MLGYGMRRMTTVEEGCPVRDEKAAMRSEPDLAANPLADLEQASPEQHSPAGDSPHARMLLISCAAGWACLFINLAWTAWAVVAHPVDSSSLIGILYEGSCSLTSSLSTWLHLLINIISTALLAASNFCMQVSLSPTREEVDAAHARKKALAIGMPSLRNLGWTSKLRGFVWVMLAVGSIPMHLVFNSAIFTAISVSEYTFAVADESFLTDPDSWNATSSTGSTSRTSTPWSVGTDEFRNVGQWERLTPDECLEEYGAELVTNRRNVLVVVDPNDRTVDLNYVSVESDRLADYGDPIRDHQLRGGYRHFRSGIEAYLAPKHYDWMCFGTLLNTAGVSDYGQRPGVANLPGSTDSSAVYVCDPSLLAESQKDWRIVDTPYDYRVRYCLSEPMEESCRLEYSPVILGIICAANLLKAVMMTVLFVVHWRTASLLTLGDAIASFLDRPDETTADRCLWTNKDFSSTKRWTREPAPRTLSTAKRYGSCPSRLRWFLTVLAVIAALGTLIGLLLQGIQGDARDASVTISALWDRGFGTINTISLIGKGRGGNASWRRSTLAMVILANTPQLLLSILYYAYNALFTAMCAGAEWADFGQRICRLRTKPLRVSRPQGKQRKSYYLQLPFRFAIPLLVLSVVLHWLTSQALFLAKVDGRDENLITTCGYSNIAIIFAIIVGALALVYLLATARMPLGSNMPVVGSSSAAISAACHPLLTPHVDVRNDCIAWGVETEGREVDAPRGEDGRRVYHVALTSGETRAPYPGESYI